MIELETDLFEATRNGAWKMGRQLWRQLPEEFFHVFVLVEDVCCSGPDRLYRASVVRAYY